MTALSLCTCCWSLLAARGLLRGLRAGGALGDLALLCGDRRLQYLPRVGDCLVVLGVYVNDVGLAVFGLVIFVQALLSCSIFVFFV